MADDMVSLNPDDFYQIYIKLVDEFIDRFNGKEQVVDSSLSQRDMRMMNLLRLFDIGLLKSADSVEMEQAKSMCGVVIDSCVNLRYNDSGWFGIAECNALLRSKPIKLMVRLKVVPVEEDTYTWVIDSVYGEALKLTPSMRDISISLMPDAHETDFLALRRVTNEKDDYILNYAPSTFKPDETSVFFALVYNGLLKIESISDVEFQFNQIPGYSFSISYFNRDGSNSGWLISSMKKV